MPPTPLCPAGHLPHKEGDRLGVLTSLQSQHQRWSRGCRDSISPPVGEMAGRPEGGERHTLRFDRPPSPAQKP
ncbi:hypothetical protein CTT39_07290 [Agrobacterium rosae]|nr:hypothetical protein CTT39_07290 [Agrobacterium rosae]